MEEKTCIYLMFTHVLSLSYFLTKYYFKSAGNAVMWKHTKTHFWLQRRNISYVFWRL